MEGQSLALIEAMWCYRGAIVTDVGGATELVKEGETGFVAEVSSTVSLEQALERAWNHRADWQNIGLSAGQSIRTKYAKKSPVVVFADKIKEHLQSI
jgi:glycosyltransferase involved in cell wall biosynthesis